MAGILVLIIIILSLFFGISYLIKKRKDNKKKTGSYGLGSLITIIVVIGLLATISIVALNAYKEAEIKYGIKESQETYLKNINKYKNFSNKEAKELSMKLYLLDRCEGGEKTIERLGMVDSNAVIYSCMELLRLNIKKKDLPKSKNELEGLKYLNTINFGKALDDYKSFINE
tara:strand:+ start:186 stop:701 length:516 start_codon:yes stop_codon:yes gene_type:complete